MERSARAVGSVPAGLAHPAETEAAVRSDLDRGGLGGPNRVLHRLHKILRVKNQLLHRLLVLLRASTKQGKISITTTKQLSLQTSCNPHAVSINRLFGTPK